MIKTIKGQYRQGDVLVQNHRPAAAPVAGKADDGNAHILAHGETTGHHHLLRGPQVVYFRDAIGGGCAIIGDAGANLTHQEHGPIPVEPSKKEVIRQREYSPEAIRNVAD